MAPEGRASVTVIANGRNWTTSVTGSTDRWFTIGNWKLASGRLFTDDEQTAGGAVCIIGETVRREIYGGTRGLGEQLRIKQFSCEVIGILAAKGQAAMGNDQDDTVVVPLHTLQRRVTGNQRINTLLVSMQDGTDSARLKASLTQLLRERRKLADGEDDNFNVLDTQQLADTLSGTTKVMTTLLGAVAAVSLLVGGIGIMNIMLVSVTERTREIGLRLAIGALEREVLLQFLIEAVVLASLGGIVGIVIATAASIVLADSDGRALSLRPGDQPAVVRVLRRHRRAVRVLSRTAGGATRPDRGAAARVDRAFRGDGAPPWPPPRLCHNRPAWEIRAPSPSLRGSSIRHQPRQALATRKHARKVESASSNYAAARRAERVKVERVAAAVDRNADVALAYPRVDRQGDSPR